MNELWDKQVPVESCLETDDALTAAIESSAPYDVEDEKNFEGRSQIHISSFALLEIPKAY